jgi:hypothetical protein
MWRFRTVVLGLLGLALVVAASLVAARAQDERTGSRSAFMRQKLEFAKNVLEGLTVENFDLIEKNARGMKRLSAAAEWEVASIPNIDEYLPYTNEFQRLCDEVVKAAKEKNIDGATLGYVRLTTNCVNCHKYVRANRKP